MTLLRLLQFVISALQPMGSKSLLGAKHTKYFSINHANFTLILTDRKSLSIV